MASSFFPRGMGGMLGPTVLVATMLLVASCGDGRNTNQSRIDGNAFIQMAQQATCADIKNKLYVIDQVMVLSDRAGNCPDASFSQVLYGPTINDVYCTNQDSIAGPVKRCDVATFQSIFDTMIANLAQPDLGLGPAHSVEILLK